MATTKRASKAKPPKRVDRRKTTSTRITPELRAQLEESVAQSGRSLAQEIEVRLEQAFLMDREIETVFGDRATYRLMGILASTKKHIEEKTRQEGLTNDETRSAILACWTPLLKEMVLSDSQLQADNDLEDRGTAFGKGFADKVLAAAVEADNKSDEET